MVWNLPKPKQNKKHELQANARKYSTGGKKPDYC